MFATLSTQVFSEALRVVFLVIAPLVLVVALAGSLAAILQGALGIRESVINYCFKLIAIILACYILTPLAKELILKLIILILN